MARCSQRDRQAAATTLSACRRRGLSRRQSERSGARRSAGRRPPADRQDRLGAAGRRRVATSAATGSTRWPTISRAAAPRARTCCSSRRARSRSGAAISASPADRLRLEEKQAAAATGQIRLAHAYLRGARPARHRRRADPARPPTTPRSAAVISTRARRSAQLLALGAVPVINENDTVATAEIRFGDNDRLAARVAQMISADTLVLLSDIDGLYTADPRRDPRRAPSARGARDHAGDRGDGRRRAARLQLGRHGDQARCRAHRDGRRLPHGDRARRRAASAARAIEDGARVDLVHARRRAAHGAQALDRRRGQPVGRAHRRRRRRERAAPRHAACCRPASSRSRATFERGDAVVVRSRDGAELGARALAPIRAPTPARIAGHKSGEIEAILGYRGRDEMIHRDDLVVSERP